MNTFRALALAAALLPCAAQADTLTTPARVSERAARSMLMALAPAGARLVAVGERGIIVYSDDNGAVWHQAEVPVSVTLTGVHFNDPRHGTAVGHDGVVLTSDDAGRHWRKRLDGNQINRMLEQEATAAVERARGVPAQLEQAQNAALDLQAATKFGPSRPLLAVWYRQSTLGFAVGAFGQALRTRDGGASWESLGGRIANPDGLHFNAIGHSADGAVMIAGEGGRVYRSNDDGDSWHAIDTGYKGPLYGVIETAPGKLLAYGFGGNALRSDDGGKHWSALPRLGSKNLIGAVLSADGKLLLAARDGAIFRSADRGRSFECVHVGRRLELAGMALAGNHIALAGIGGVHTEGTP
ncbi:MAG: YCF48-related protein [Pseudomonadota bacterium]